MLLGPPCLSIRLDTSGNVEAVVDAPRIFQAKRRVEAAASGSRLAFDWNYRRLALKCPAGRASRGRAIFTVRGAPQEITVVELLAGAFRAGLIGHGDESESAGSAGHFIGDDGGLANLASLAKKFAEVVFGHIERQVADVEFAVGHFILGFVSGSYHWLTPVVGLKSPLGRPRLAPRKKPQLATYHAPLKGSSKP